MVIDFEYIIYKGKYFSVEWYYSEKGDSQAVNLGRRAYELARNRPEIVDTYGWILVQTGEFIEGEKTLQEAVVLAPEHQEIIYHLGYSLHKLGRQDEADLPLLDDRISLRAQACVHEELVDVPESAHPAVHEVLALAVSVEASRDHALRGPVGALAVQAGDPQVDLGHRQGLAGLATGEDHVAHGAAAEALGALLSEDPGDGVGDIALPAAVRADDPGHAGLEIELLLVAERLEAGDLDPFQAHDSPRYCELAAL